MQNSDFIITLAWPEGKIASVGSWYDKILGLNRKYKIGHTAVILINSLTKKVYYYDFGRYDTPNGTGRVRNYKTDPELKIKSTAIIEKNNIINLSEIISEISKKKSTHGEGILYYKVLNNINASDGIEYAKNKQDIGTISFGPFSNKSLNCGRFAYNTIEQSEVNTLNRLKVIVNDILLRIPLLKKISIRFYFEQYKN